MRALTLAVLCATVATTALADPLGGGPNGKGPDGLGPPGHALSDDTPLSPEGQLTTGADQNVARDAVDAGKAMPLADISQRIAAALGVRVIDARIIRTGGTFIYRLVVLNAEGVSRRVFVDAATGNLLPGR